MLKTLRHVVSVVLLLAGIILLGWGMLPDRTRAIEQFISPAEMQLPGDGTAAIATLMEYRQVRLEWPATMRIGDQETIRLVFETVTSEIIVQKPAADLANVYDKYNLMAEGRLEVGGLQVDPANPRRESLPQGQTVTYLWQVRAQEAGNYTGTIWLSLRFLPLDGGPASQVPVFVRDLDIQANSLLGLSGPIARAAGGVGIVVGLGLCFDVMIGLIKKITTKDTKDTKEI